MFIFLLLNLNERNQFILKSLNRLFEKLLIEYKIIIKNVFNSDIILGLLNDILKIKKILNEFLKIIISIKILFFELFNLLFIVIPIIL